MCLSVIVYLCVSHSCPLYLLPSFEAGPPWDFGRRVGDETEKGEVGLAGSGFTGWAGGLLFGTTLRTLQFPLQISGSSVPPPPFAIPPCCASGLA